MAAPVKERRPEAAPVRPVRLGPRDVVVQRRPDGTIHLKSPHALARYPAKLTERLEYWAATAPGRVYLAQRDATGGWRKLTYAETLEKVRRIGAALLQRGLSPERPIAILSGNDIEHALIGLAAMYVGVPYAPVSPAYSLISDDFGKLRSIVELLTPGLVFTADGEAYRRAIEAVVPPDVEVVVGRNPLPCRPTTPLQTLLTPAATADADAAHARVRPDTIVKFLFTSGSTGTPKAVINTQRMWCANQAMILSQLAFFEDDPPVIVDWSPWHHTAGGNHNFGFVLYNGGTLYIDEGKPVPGLIETTVKNLREVATNWYFTVPKGYEALLPYLRADAQLRNTFFRRLKVLWFAGAALSQSVFDEMQELALATCGERIMFLTGLGSTESAPMAIARMWQSKDSTNMGVPVAGRGAQARAVRRQARGAAARAQHHAGLLAPARADRGGLRRGRLLQARRRAQIRRPRAIRARACCSTAASPRTSSSRPAPGSMSARCARACWRSSRLMRATSSSPAPTATRSAR